MEDSKVIGCKRAIEGLKPAACMILVQVVLAGTNIFYKLALNDGMDVKILVAYRYIFAAAFLCPVALFLERKKRPTLTWTVLLQAFCCGLFGGALGQNTYITSLKMTSATFATAMTNLIPAITFVLAVFFRLEKFGIGTATGQAKVAGTIAGLGGAMLLTLFKGPDINLWESHINLLVHGHRQAMVPHVSSDRIAGSLLAISSCLSISIWMIIQAKMSNAYPCHYSSTALMCFMGSIQSTVYALCLNREMTQWRLHFDIRLLTVSYSGIVGSGLIFSAISWCIQQRGPVFASVFNPLLLVLVAFLGSLLLNEKLHLGSIIGTVLIIIGLYMVLWGKTREIAARAAELASESAKVASESISEREPLEILVVDGITISRNASLDRNASFARNARQSDVKANEPEIAPKEKTIISKDS